MNGFRIIGDRKREIINKVNLHLLELGSKGVNVRMLLKICNIKGDSFTITTKQWIGAHGRIVQFRKDNGL